MAAADVIRRIEVVSPHIDQCSLSGAPMTGTYASVMRAECGGIELVVKRYRMDDEKTDRGDVAREIIYLEHVRNQSIRYAGEGDWQALRVADTLTKTFPLLYGTRAVDGRVELVMQRMHGQPLYRWAHAHRSLGEWYQLLTALHSALYILDTLLGIDHNDLHGSNILVSHDGPRVFDFGLAEPATHSGVNFAKLLWLCVVGGYFPDALGLRVLSLYSDAHVFRYDDASSLYEHAQVQYRRDYAEDYPTYDVELFADADRSGKWLDETMCDLMRR